MFWGPTSDPDPHTWIHSPVNYQHGNNVKNLSKTTLKKHPVQPPISGHPLD